MTAQTDPTPIKLSGLAVDLPAHEYPPTVWTGGKNVEVIDGVEQRARGFGRIFGSTIEAPRFLVNTRQAGVSQWVYGGDTKIGYTEGAAHTDITGTLSFNSAAVVSPWSGGVINQNAILNNLTGPPAYWQPGTAAALELPDWPANRKAAAVRVFREYIIAMNLTDGATTDPDAFAWSDAAPTGQVPQSWTPGSQSQAGAASASFTPGALVDGITLREQFYLGKQHAIYVISLVGGQFIFRQRPVFSTFGFLSRNCAIEFRGRLFILTDGDFVATDGVNTESVIDGRIRSALFSGIDIDNFGNSFVALDKKRKQIWVCVPLAGSTFPNRAAVYSIKDNEWGIRDLGVNTWAHGIEGVVSKPIGEPTWGDRTTTWANDPTRWGDGGSSPLQETLMFADAGSLLQAMDERDDFDGEIPLAQLRREGLDLGKPGIYKYINRAWPRIDGPPGTLVRMRFGGQDHSSGPVTWDQWHSVIIGETEYLDVNAAGRLIALELDSLTAEIWRAPSSSVEIQLQGAF